MREIAYRLGTVAFKLRLYRLSDALTELSTDRSQYGYGPS